MRNESYKALLSGRYKELSDAIFSTKPERVLFVQEVAAVLREARQPESLILSAMAVASCKEMLVYLEKWEKDMANEAMEILANPLLFMEKRNQTQNHELKIPSREASDIAASILLVTLRRQLERNIRNENNSQEPLPFALPFFSISKSASSPFDAEKELENVFYEYEKRLKRLWKSPIAQDLRSYMLCAMKRCHSEPLFSHDERPVYCIQGDMSKGRGAQILKLIKRAGFYVCRTDDGTGYFVSCRNDWSEPLGRFMTCVATTCVSELHVTLSQTVSFTSCEWNVEPVHSFEWAKVFERQKIQQVIASRFILNPLKELIPKIIDNSGRQLPN